VLKKKAQRREEKSKHDKEAKEQKKEKYDYRKHLKNANMDKQTKKQEMEEVKLNYLEFAWTPEANTFPSHIKKVYIDGNNCMFIHKQLRSLFLGKKHRENERLLTVIAQKLADHLPGVHFHVIFDNTPQVAKVNDLFEVSSARPNKETSDDQLVEWAEKHATEGSANNTLVITADRALSILLNNQGANLAKPGYFYTYALSVILSKSCNKQDWENFDLEGFFKN